MRSICLVACVGKKRRYGCSAEWIYQSPWFRLASKYARSGFDEWFILSAKHGLLRPGERILPYDEMLSGKKKAEREQWGKWVFECFLREIKPGVNVTILAGNLYREFLEQHLLGAGIDVSVPMRGLGIGQQLAWLKSQ